MHNIKYSNFWTKCSLKKPNLPTSECEEGKYSGLNTQSKCDWGINAIEHHNCFWRYLQSKSNPDGSMEPAYQSEITKFLALQPVKTLDVIESAMQALRNVFAGINPMDLEGDEGLGALVEALSGSALNTEGEVK